MGPWSFIDPAVPTRAGCSYETLRGLVERGVVRVDSIVRGPSTRQFWMRATRVPGVAHLLGVCHNCQEQARPDDYACGSCGAVFEVDRDRQHLGVGPIRLIAGQVPAGQVVASMGAVSPSPPSSEAPAAAPIHRPTAPGPAAPATTSSMAGDRLAKHRAARKRRRAIAIGLTAAAVVTGAAAMFAIGILAGSGETPAESPAATDP